MSDPEFIQGKHMDLKLPDIMAHRGAPQVTPENTLISFKKAHDLGAKWFECDVQITRDGEAIIMHDFSLNRTTNSEGLVASMNWRDMQNLDAGSWFAPQFAGEKIPTLAETLEFVAKNNMGINLELKCADPHREEMLAEIVHEHVKQFTQPVLISSFNFDVLKAYRSYDPKAYLGLNCEGWNLQHIRRAKSIDCFSIHIAEEEITPIVIEECKSNFLTVLAFTVNNPERAKTLLRQGVKCLFSDCLFA